MCNHFQGGRVLGRGGVVCVWEGGREGAREGVSKGLRAKYRFSSSSELCLVGELL